MMQLSSAHVSRRVSPLHKMVDSAAMGEDGVKWNHVLHYLRAHCKVRDDEVESSSQSSDDDNATRNRSNRKKKASGKSGKSIVILEENPLPDYYIATEELKQEIWVDKSKGDSVLRSCLSCAPPKVIAALCFLLPEALLTPDTRNRVVLHYACRYPVSERLDAVMRVLITACPMALLHRDDDGRTPLHYLFWYNAKDRSPAIVSLFCQNLVSVKGAFSKLRQPIIQRLPRGSLSPTLSKQDRRQQRQAEKEKQSQFPLPEIPKPGKTSKVPYTAAIIPDASHGCLPLHYAVMEGASVDAIQVLFQAFPQSKNCVDRYGRTPLHWYLGAGTLDIWRTADSSPQHVSGEEVHMDLCQSDVSTKSYDRPIQQEVVQLLLSSRVARTADFQQRYPLHWAVCFLAHNFMLSSKPGWAMSLQVVQLLLDHFVGQLICCDDRKMTPAILLFDTVARIQTKVRERRDGEIMSQWIPENFFDPPIELIEMLLKHPDPSANANVAAVEDESGRLPVHAALEVASAPGCIALLIKYHPTALIHTAEDSLFVPLHSAFCSKYNAPLQTAEIVILLLQSIQAGRYGTFVDGRLAMKMEDAAGYYPIHYAARNGASVEVIRTLVERYPKTAYLPTPSGDLPIHCLISDELISSITLDFEGRSSLGPEKSQNDSAQSKEDNEELLHTTREKMNTLLRPLLSEPNKLAVADHQYGMLPLHCAVLFDAANYSMLLRMLELQPDSATKFTKANAFFGSCSPLDLHEMRKPLKSDSIQRKDAVGYWYRKRELLFSFSPTLESHRHRQELLDQCVRVVIDELGEVSPLQDQNDENYRFHLKSSQKMKADDPLELEITHSVSNMERAVLQAFGFQQSRPPRTAGNKPSTQSGSVSARSKSLAGSRQSVTADEEGGNGKDGKHKTNQRTLKKTSSSMYDEDNTSYDALTEWYESESSGDETDEAFSSEAEESNDGSDDDEYNSEGEVLSGDPSRSFGYTTSGSRLRTTFEDCSAVSEDDDESGSDDEDDDSGSLSITDETGTRRTFDDDESTLLSRQPTVESERKNAFDTMKETLDIEEKKDDYSFGGEIKSMLTTPRACNNNRKQRLQPKPKKLPFQKPEYISEVAMRLWTFFVLYCDPSNPNDNYVKQISDIIDEIKFSTVERLASIPIPPYAKHYIEADDTETLSFRDVASPKCRELIHKTCYFVGRYDLSLQQQQQQENNVSVLVSRTSDGTSVTIRALEWLFTTEEATPSRDTGVAIENIWATGEIPAEIGVTFRTQKRAVWIKFTKDKCVYDNEVSNRLALGIPVEEDEKLNTSKSFLAGVVPLLSHYNAYNIERKKDRTYNVDINDERFSVINLFGGNVESEHFKFHLNQYPYALVYPASSLGGTLFDYYFQYGMQDIRQSKEENRFICASVASTLSKMHEQDIVHGDVAVRNLIIPSNTQNSSLKNNWSLFGLHMSSFLQDETSYLGGITSQGYPQFAADTLPPEMFAKLSPEQLKLYKKYWSIVQSVVQVKIDSKIIDPIVDLSTGESYVVKCHFLPFTNNEMFSQERLFSIPQLPYELVPRSKSADIWALGQLVFLLSTGRSLFPVEAISGRLLEYSSVFQWKPEPVIYEYVQNPVAQDVLLVLLSSVSERSKVKLGSILSHPFFVGENGSSITLVNQITEKRSVECAAYKREQHRRLFENLERTWLADRTIALNCWDFEFLEKIHLSPSEIVRGLSARKDGAQLPCNFIILPYKLSMSNGLSEPERHLAEITGSELLRLSKVCFFTSVMKQATSGPDEAVTHKWSSSEMLRVLDLSSDEFGDVQTEMAELAAKHVEAFRHDPLSVGLKLVQKRIRNVLDCYRDRTLYLYLVDELTCEPILDELFPREVPEEWRQSILQNCILPMHLCALHARGVSRGVSGQAKLFFNDENHTIPPSWTDAAKSLNHQLNEVAFVKEIQLLQDALTDMFGTRHNIGDDDIQLVRDFVFEMESRRNKCGVKRVVCAGASLWTTPEGVKIIEQTSRALSFQDALLKSRWSESKLKEYRLQVETLSSGEKGSHKK